MPNKDGTGPNGQGSKTGRQMGKCEGAQPAERGFGGRGLGPCGRGMRRGLGRGFGFSQSGFDEVKLSDEQKVKILEAQKEDIEKELKSLKK